MKLDVALWLFRVPWQQMCASGATCKLSSSFCAPVTHIGRFNRLLNVCHQQSISAVVPLQK